MEFNLNDEGTMVTLFVNGTVYHINKERFVKTSKNEWITSNDKFSFEIKRVEDDIVDLIITGKNTWFQISFSENKHEDIYNDLYRVIKMINNIVKYYIV